MAPRTPSEVWRPCWRGRWSFPWATRARPSGAPGTTPAAAGTARAQAVTTVRTRAAARMAGRGDGAPARRSATHHRQVRHGGLEHDGAGSPDSGSEERLADGRGDDEERLAGGHVHGDRGELDPPRLPDHRG